MSFLDLDEWLFELAKQVEVVFSPIASDTKTYPEGVDLALVEGGVGTSDNLALIRQVRERTRLLVSFGDCAITANVPGLRNHLGGEAAVLDRAYRDLADGSAQWPRAPGIVPELLERVLPVHELVPVDLFLPGCPPPAERIRTLLDALLRGERPVMEGAGMIRFG
jgi:NAD-reducing hydrogenase small subunit